MSRNRYSILNFECYIYAYDPFAYLLGSTFAASVPVTIFVNIGNSRAFVHRIKGQEMHLSDSCSCLTCHNNNNNNNNPITMLSHFAYLTWKQIIFHTKYLLGIA
jgi:hypothetical protein